MIEHVVLSKADKLILASYQSMLDGLSLYLGDGYEYVLHSLEDLGHSIIKIINGHYTNRSVGAPITDLALSMLREMRKAQDLSPRVYFNHRDGSTLKSATIPILGEDHRVIGLLCINFYYDVSLSQFLAAFIPDAPAPKEIESFNSDVEDLIGIALNRAKQTVYGTCVASTNRNKEIIRLLYEQGIFNMKDSVVKTAEYLGISKNTVYLHLRNLKAE